MAFTTGAKMKFKDRTKWIFAETLIEMAKEKSVEKVEEEVADVLLYCYMLCDCYGLDPIATMKKKMKRNAEKYPVERSYGSSKRYDE